MQIDSLAGAVRQSVSFIFFHKKLRTGQTELVDTLFDIAYHKQIMLSIPLTADGSKNLFLHQVGILIFIDHDLGIASRKLSGRLCRRFATIRLSVHQHLKRHMFHVVKVQQIFLPLGRCQIFPKM